MPYAPATACWYFGVKQKNPVRSAALRACTTSAGSVTIGRDFHSSTFRVHVSTIHGISLMESETKRLRLICKVDECKPLTTGSLLMTVAKVGQCRLTLSKPP